MVLKKYKNFFGIASNLTLKKKTKKKTENLLKFEYVNNTNVVYVPHSRKYSSQEIGFSSVILKYIGPSGGSSVSTVSSFLMC